MKGVGRGKGRPKKEIIPPPKRTRKKVDNSKEIAARQEKVKEEHKLSREQRARKRAGLPPLELPPAPEPTTNGEVVDSSVAAEELQKGESTVELETKGDQEMLGVRKPTVGGSKVAASESEAIGKSQTVVRSLID